MKTTQPLQYIGWFRCLFLWCGVVWCGVVCCHVLYVTTFLPWYDNVTPGKNTELTE